MKIQKWLMLAIALGLMAGTAGALTWLRANQKLGQPGLKAMPIPGNVMMKIDLPEQAAGFTSTNVPESDVELGYFPKDTSYAHRWYQAPDGFGVSATVIMMGADRTSIHRPEYCLPGQGWNIESKQVVQIPIADRPAYDLPVMKWVLSKTAETVDGRNRTFSGLYVFWFVADKEQTTDNVHLQLYLMRDLLSTGVLQRWAYMSYFTVCEPGQEDATFERVKQLIAASVPEYQLPPVKR